MMVIGHWGTGAILFALVAATSLSACGGDDDSEKMEESGSTGGSDSGRSNIECVAAESSMGGNGGAMSASATCVNDTDCDAVESGDYRAQAKDCLVDNCLGLSDPDERGACTAECIVEQISATAECASCYGSSAACSSVNCFAECIEDGDAPQCVECQAENGCTAQFFECSGLAEPE